jgi:hypothetical protein
MTNEFFYFSILLIAVLRVLTKIIIFRENLKEKKKGKQRLGTSK